MLRQPKEKRNLSSYALEHESKNIRILNEVLGNTELTAAEERSLVWLCGFETSTIKNIVSAFQKVRHQELDKPIEIDRPRKNKEIEIER